MCGISGIYGLRSEATGRDLVSKMNDAISHRGPNDQGIYFDGIVTLGHRRLSIIDLSSAGHQPMHSVDDRFSIVFNGEIYNYSEIKNKLLNEFGSEVSFRTNSDTEVLLVAFQKWGKDCLKELNGMFAFAIWDKFSKKLFIARDRLGIKPLYYFKEEGNFVFASEIRALLASGVVPRRADKNGVVDFLRYQTVHAPNTIIRNVFMLMPGHFLTISEDKFEIAEYWSLQKNINSDSNKKNIGEIKKDIRQLLLESVERRLVSDVPFGAFLSGGIDSSAIVGLMSEVSNRKVQTFSIVFDESEYSEAKYARLISNKFGTEHHEIKLTPNDFLDELNPGLKSMDHPSIDGLNTFIVSKHTKKAGITMALSGLGGDEIFGGYDIFKRSVSLKKNNWLWHSPKVLRSLIGRLYSGLKNDVASKKIEQLLSLDSGAFNNSYPISRQFLDDKTIAGLLVNYSLPGNEVLDILTKQLKNAQDEEHFLSEVSIAEISTYMQNVLLRDTDQMSMAHALEVRVPFLDYKLIEYVLGVNDSIKFPSYPKKLLVESLGELLPSEIVHRPKMGFLFPWELWLKNELRDFCESKINNLGNNDFFDKSVLTKYWKSYLAGDKRIGWARIWLFVVLSNWLSENKVELE